jgi:hypothetical protein
MNCQYCRKGMQHYHKCIDCHYKCMDEGEYTICLDFKYRKTSVIHNASVIKKFDYLLDITLLNIKQKLQTILIFL